MNQRPDEEYEKAPSPRDATTIRENTNRSRMEKLIIRFCNS